MATHPSRELDSPSPGAQPAPREENSWLLRRLDSLLSPELRRASPTALVRHRFLVGAASFLLFFTLVYLLSALVTPSKAVPPLLATMGYLATLVVARGARTLVAPAMVLVVTLGIGMVGSVFMTLSPNASVHATTMLLPALAAYLLGPRLGLLMTGVFILALMVCFPLYLLHQGIAYAAAPTHIGPSHFFGGLAFLGAWWLGSLNSTARDAAQHSLESTLRVLRESEGKLSSVIESTDDVVISLDAQGRVITANSSAQRMYQQRLGTPLHPGQPLLPSGHERARLWELRLSQVMQGERLRVEEEHLIGERRVALDISLSPILGEEGRPVGMTIFGRDITTRKEAEARLGEMHRTLVDVSRQAGMAEVATGVLHNVGNTLNSVNISASLLTDQLRKSRLTNLAKAIQLLRENTADFTAFLTRDPQGRKLPHYLIALSDQLQEERESMIHEMASLSESVDHIKSIVSMQQKHARAAGAVEEVAVPRLIDEALRLHAVSFERHGIRIERDYAQVPSISVDRHKLLQILINLLSNARHALMDSPQQDKRLTIHVRREPEGERMLIQVEDNGVGISPEHLPQLFTQGFTTKKEGHGFGLHISALAATEMKGRLFCESPGPGQGATFTLELPLETS
ncbi:two-component system sensor histidine kinase NtrB [Hyalangium gracile]|uniref:two-component system sensor histidine kinase NtrB n=1 Tax=Hyalangium gracile TaxID=394092 RepID=UPI001CCC5829|nr:ATP-binding protein [Hyalangium gracile]